MRGQGAIPVASFRKLFHSLPLTPIVNMFKLLLIFTFIAQSIVANPVNVWLNPYKTVDLSHPQDKNAIGYPLFEPYKRTPSIQRYLGPPGQW